MDFLLPKRGDLANIEYWTIVVVLAFAAMGVADQTTPSTQFPTPPAVQEKVPPNTLPTAEDTEIESTAADVETQRRFDNLRNELRHELLGNRADTINWWLTATAIFLTFFGIVVVLGGYIGFRRFREIEAEAKKYAEEARKSAEKIKELKKRAEEDYAHLSRMAEMAEQPSHLLLNIEYSVGDDTPLSILLDRGRREPDIAQEVEETVQEVRRNPQASPLARAIADAYSLQRTGRIEEAIAKWRSIANIAETIDSDLAARAWLSVGGCLLYEKRNVEDVGNNIQEELFAFDRAIRLKPDYADAYCHRGVARGGLGKLEDAIEDFDQAIRLKPDYAEAYCSRGAVKSGLGQHEAALTDYDRAIRLKPDYADAYYNRAATKRALKRHDKATLADLDQALLFKPDFVDAYYNRGVVRGKLEEYEAAIEDFDQAIRLKPHYAEAYRNRGFANQEHGRVEKARDDFKVALDLANKAGNDKLKAEVEQLLQKLDNTD